jgi:hypothetical protein
MKTFSSCSALVNSFDNGDNVIGCSILTNWHPADIQNGVGIIPNADGDCIFVNVATGIIIGSQLRSCPVIGSDAI